MSVKSTYLPWVRLGAASLIDSGDTSEGRASVAITGHVQVNGQTQAEIPEVQLQLYGPGDVIGIDRRQVIRTEPPPGSTRMPSNYFPLIEFDRADFPWLFTPAMADAQGRLWPWIFLVVAPQERVTLTAAGTRPTPVLRIPREELPDLADAWAWAHSQVASGENAPSIAEQLRQNAPQTLSRIFSPRHLRPRTAYIACLVPTFEAGRLAGLGRAPASGAPEAGGAQFAWQVAGSGSDLIELPVYYHWEFTTGEAEDFESLVDRLEERPVPDDVGTRPVVIDPATLDALADVCGDDIDAAALTELAEHTFQIEGVLRNPERTRPAMPDPMRSGLRCLLNQRREQEVAPAEPGEVLSDWVRSVLRCVADEAGDQDGAPSDADEELPGLARIVLRCILNLRKEEDATASEPDVGLRDLVRAVVRHFRNRRTQEDAAPAEPVVAPPIYGGRHAAVERIRSDHETPRWIRELNLDPRYRAVAALGTLVIQDQQEQLMASAWQQAGDIERVNQLIRQAQLAQEVDLRTLDRQIRPLPAARALQLAGPAAGRITMSPNTLREQLRQSPLPEAAGSAPFRRLLHRRPAKPGPAEAPAQTLLDQVATKELTLAPRRATTGMVLAAAGEEEDALLEVLRTAREAEEAAVGEGTPTEKLRLLEAAEDHLTQEPPVQAMAQPEEKPALSLAQVRDTLVQRLDPARTVPQRLRAQIAVNPETQAAVERLQRRPDAGTDADIIDTFEIGPRFPQPMVEALRDISQDLLLPGVEKVPEDTILLLATNEPFVEAYMVGLNHEMSREFLWREYPTNLRATYFHQFWDTAGSLTPAPDLPQDIHAWDPEQGLGAHLRRDGSGDRIVLLIRGELLRRFPTAVIYAIKAEWDGDNRRPAKNADEVYPIFRGRLKPDLTFLGFPLTTSQVLGSRDRDDDAPGWYLVIQQQPTEPRFGLDFTGEGETVEALTTWRELGWDQLDIWGHIRDDGRYLDLAGLLADRAPIDGVAWGRNAAEMAFITRQPPFRLVIHADRLLKRDRGEDNDA